MNRDLRTVLAVIAIAAMVVLAVAALRTTFTVVEQLPAVDLGTPGDTVPGGTPIATVIGRRQSGGGSFLWFRRGDGTSEVTVQFYAPAACVGPVAEGGTWPTADRSCSSDVPIAGTISGSGIAVTGEAVVAVVTEVTADCFEAVRIGDFWPPVTGECTSAVG